MASDTGLVEFVLTHADGSLDLVGRNEVDGVEFDLVVFVDETDWGNPEAVRRELRSAISNGSVSVTDRHDNRTIEVKVAVDGSDGIALAVGEQALMLASARRAELTWTPPADLAAPCVFVIVNSELRYEFNHPLSDHFGRVYTLTLEALPFTRSVASVVIDAFPPFVAAPTVLDDQTTTTGWTGTTGMSFSVSSGGVVISITGSGTGGDRAVLTKSLPRTKRFLAIEHEAFGGGGIAFGATTPFSVASASAYIYPPIVGVDGKWTFFDLASLSGATIEAISFDVYRGATSDSVRILTIAESDSATSAAARQSLRTIEIPGSVAAEGSILVESRDSAVDGSGSSLGTVFLYTGPSYDPRLSTGRLGGFGVADGGTLSGGYDTGTALGYARRASDIPDGSYALWVNGWSTLANVSVDWTVTVSLAQWSDIYIKHETLTSWTVNTFQTGARNLFLLGSVDLPGLKLDEANANYFLDFTFETSHTMNFDEGLLFNRTEGDLTIVNTDAFKQRIDVTGTPSTATGATRVRFNAPTLDLPEPSVALSRGSDAMSRPATMASQLLAWGGAHRLPPGRANLYVGATGAGGPDAAVSLETYPTWHTHPTT